MPAAPQFGSSYGAPGRGIGWGAGAGAGVLPGQPGVAGMQPGTQSGVDPVTQYQQLQAANRAAQNVLGQGGFRVMGYQVPGVAPSYGPGAGMFGTVGRNQVANAQVAQAMVQPQIAALRQQNPDIEALLPGGSNYIAQKVARGEWTPQQAATEQQRLARVASNMTTGGAGTGAGGTAINGWRQAAAAYYGVDASEVTDADVAAYRAQVTKTGGAGDPTPWEWGQMSREQRQAYMNKLSGLGGSADSQTPWEWQYWNDDQRAAYLNQSAGISGGAGADPYQQGQLDLAWAQFGDEQTRWAAEQEMARQQIEAEQAYQQQVLSQQWAMAEAERQAAEEEQRRQIQAEAARQNQLYGLPTGMQYAPSFEAGGSLDQMMRAVGLQYTPIRMGAYGQ